MLSSTWFAKGEATLLLSQLWPTLVPQVELSETNGEIEICAELSISNQAAKQKLRD
jgi:hypothetical protein